MRIVITLFLVAIISLQNATAQSYSNPESMVYDSIGKRYFISNKAGNTIVQLDENNNLTNFVTSGLGEPKGLLIIGDTLISVNSKSVKGYLLSDASKVFDVSVSGSKFMNDCAADNQGNLYVSDSETDKIHKIVLKSGAYSTLIGSGINPNGLLFDQASNSLLICDWGSNAKIHSYDLTSSELTTLTSTGLSNLDGLAKDNCGNLYFSSWGSNAVYALDPSFKYKPVKIAGGYNGPADISIDLQTQKLAIPNFMANNIDIIDLGLECSSVEPISPISNSQNQELEPLIKWSTIDGTSEYELQYCTDSLFKNSIKTVKVSGTENTLPELEQLTTYYWRIRALNGNSKPMFGSVSSFTTKEKVSFIESPTSTDYTTDFYPNPCKESIHFTSDILKIEIYDLSGKVVFHSTNCAATINVSNLKQGTYIIEYASSNGTQNRQLLVKH